jgi:hypothetical protein
MQERTAEHGQAPVHVVARGKILLIDEDLNDREYHSKILQG